MSIYVKHNRNSFPLYYIMRGLQKVYLTAYEVQKLAASGDVKLIEVK